MVENRSGAKQSPTLPKGHFGIFHFYDLREVSVLIPFLEHQLVKPSWWVPQFDLRKLSLYAVASGCILSVAGRNGCELLVVVY